LAALTLPNEQGKTSMARYMIVYLGGEQPADPAESKRHFTQYKQWLSSLGNSAISPANPLKNTRTIQSDGTIITGSSAAMSGYTLIEADSMEQALEIAKACPFLATGGSLEVSELAQMPS
jgi:hypothetical protein